MQFILVCLIFLGAMFISEARYIHFIRANRGGRSERRAARRREQRAEIARFQEAQMEETRLLEMKQRKCRHVISLFETSPTSCPVPPKTTYNVYEPSGRAELWNFYKTQCVPAEKKRSIGFWIFIILMFVCIASSIKT
jgi:hypothetical protein